MRRTTVQSRRFSLMSSPGQYCHLPAPWLQLGGTPETKGSLPADTQLLHGSLIPFCTAVFWYQAQLESPLPVSAPAKWKRPEAGQAKRGGAQRWPYRQLLFLMHSLGVQRCRAQKAGYLWTRFIWLFYGKGGRTSCLTQWSVGSHSKWTF